VRSAGQAGRLRGRRQAVVVDPRADWRRDTINGVFIAFIINVIIISIINND